MTNANPSIDPANNDSLTGAFKHILDKLKNDLNNRLPAKVVAFDRTKNRVQVQPLITILTTDNSQVSRAQIASLPVKQMGGGGFILNFNLKPGDLGWIEACDRDISIFLQSYAESKPNTLRKHNFSDSVFCPDVMTGFTINSNDSDNAVFQSLNATVRISLATNKITLTAPDIVLQTLVSDAVKIDSNGTVSINTTTGAFEPPRLTTSQKNAIPSPTAGMMVYDTTLNKLSVFTGSIWETVMSS